MGKKKNTKHEVVEDTDEMEVESNVPQQKKGKKKRRKDEDEEEDIARELEQMRLEEEGAVNGVEKVAEKSQSDASEKKSNKKTSDNDSTEEEEVVKVKSKFSGFSALMDDDMCDDGDDEQQESEEEAPPTSKAPPPKVNNKKKDKQKMPPKNEDDDWSVLEEFSNKKKEETKVENNKKEGKKQKKKDKKNKQQAEDDEDFDQLLEEAKQLDKPVKEDKVEEKQPLEKEQPKEEPAEPKVKKNKKNKKESPPEEDASEVVTAKEGEEPSTPPNEESGGKKKKKKKLTAEEKKKKKEEEEEMERLKKEEEDEKKGGKKGLNKKMLAAVKEAQQKIKEAEEEQRRKEEEEERLEKQRIEEETERLKLEEERRERKKQKDKERKERQKAAGKPVSAKQRMELRRAQEMLSHLKAAGHVIPESGEKKTTARPGSKAFKKKKISKQEEKTKEEVAAEEAEPSKEQSPPAVEEDDGIKDSWDVSSDEEEETEEITNEKTSGENTSAEEEDEDASEEESEDEMDAMEKVRRRILARKEKNENNRSLEQLRSPVICVLGHVDHGKTKILDKLRRTNVQEGEVGGITQQIGATNVPAEAIAQQTKMVKSFDVERIQFPGLLIIDTPGHESFSNLRNRGSSLCDAAILVIDVTQGLEPQTIESIKLLTSKEVPFVIALNKVDKIYEWEPNCHKDIREVLKNQPGPSVSDYENRTKEIILKLTEQGLNVALFYENPDPETYINLIPVSAISGDGMGNLIAMVCDMCQDKHADKLMYSEELQCIVLEVKTAQGYGTTIDVILINGRLKQGETMILAGTDGVIATQIKGLLMPKPMKEIRVKGMYDEKTEIKAAQGIKVAAKELDKAIAGLTMRVAKSEDEIEYLKEVVEKDFAQVMKSMKTYDKGVYVQASTLGALEALLQFFKSKKIRYSNIRVGPVVKRDVMRATAMLEHDEKYAVILAFDVKVDRDAQELADKEGVKIFTEETIYHLGDRYVEFLEEHKRKKQEENRAVAVFPCKLKVLPNSVFNKRDPIVMGVNVESGILRTGTVLCVPGKEFVNIGVVTSMEFDHKQVDIAKKGVDVCIKVDPAQGTTPKLFGRHFDESDEIVSKISRESINACKDFFRDDLSKADWKLMSELKSLFSIL